MERCTGFLRARHGGPLGGPACRGSGPAQPRVTIALVMPGLVIGRFPCAGLVGRRARGCSR